MDILGKYCASIGMMIEKLKQTILFETFNMSTPKIDKPACLDGNKHDM